MAVSPRTVTVRATRAVASHTHGPRKTKQWKTSSLKVRRTAMMIFE